jgi:hypothetical protein
MKVYIYNTFKLYVIRGIDMQSSSMFIQKYVLEPMGLTQIKISCLPS